MGGESSREGDKDVEKTAVVNQGPIPHGLVGTESVVESIVTRSPRWSGGDKNAVGEEMPEVESAMMELLL